MDRGDQEAIPGGVNSEHSLVISGDSDSSTQQHAHFDDLLHSMNSPGDSQHSLGDKPSPFKYV